MRLIDSHCHIPVDFSEAQQLIKSAIDSEVVACLSIGTNFDDSLNSIEKAKVIKQIFPAVAIYPHEEKNMSLDQISLKFHELLKNNPEIKAVGECGIDLVEGIEGRSLSDQQELFEMQIRAALDFNLPICIHNRNGDEFIKNSLKKYIKSGLRGVIHCFNSNWELANEFLDLGFLISFSGFVTYNSRSFLHEVAKKVPNKKFLIETDSPYILPKGIKADKNEPKNVRMVAQKVSELRGETLEKVAEDSFSNAVNLFKLPL